ncbi:MAG: type II toxin-antitoxin system HicB family antitoxin [Parcubacteria group bacterium]|nr:type II toxin-antitoxin system HicB family antitoxin [Parcubacteria group bacterium]
MRKIALKNVVWKEGKDYISWNLNTGVSSFGDTKKEALESLEEALELYFEDMPFSQVVKVERPDIVPLAFEYAKTN